MGKKNRNGMGLDALFSDNPVAEEERSEAGITMVRLTLLEPNKDQPRGEFDEEKLGELADSIRENGLLQPILVRPLENGGYQIVAGERRWRASRLAGLTEVPVYVKELSDKQTMQMALIENIQRQDLTPLEEAAAYKSLMDSYGMTQQQVAEAVGKSRPTVANALRLLSLGEEVKELLTSGELSAGHARVLAGLGEEVQGELARETVRNGWSVRQLEAAAASSERIKEEKPVRESSLKKDRPFLKEFELSVNKNSNIRVKTKSVSGGGVEVSLKIGKEQDMQEVLSRLAELLVGY